MGQQLTELATS